MSVLRRFLLITLIESFACILVERGIYFFATERLGFGPVRNLWLAVLFGGAYIVGALPAHPLCRRWAEKPVLLAAICGQTAAHLLLAAHPTAGVVWVVATLIGCLNGAKWPILESYISAGQSRRDTARAIGGFNVAWAAAVPPSLVVVGPLVQWRAPSLFLLAAAASLLTLALLRPATRQPVHLPEDHPERPDADTLRRLRGLLGFSRWAMFFSYAAMFAIAAILPPLLRDRFRMPVSIATPLSAVVDFLRLAAFILLGWSVRWHMRWAPLIIATAALPGAFLLVAGGTSITALVVGQVIFGLAAGLIYYAALYYAMLVQNASVDAGGAHEALIGLGFAVGPLACLGGLYLTAHAGATEFGGIAAGMVPLSLICLVGGVLRARQFRRRPATSV